MSTRILERFNVEIEAFVLHHNAVTLTWQINISTGEDEAYKQDDIRVH